MRAIPTTLMRGGTSKGVYVLSRDLPSDPARRDAVVLALMGAGDSRQIDGLGGAHPLTSKVAIVGRPTRATADVDFLFLQVGTEQRTISTAQTCGNLLAGVGGFAIDTGLVRARDGTTPVRVHLVNTGSIAIAHTPTPGRRVTYAGTTAIDGVPGTSAPVLLEFEDIAGGTCGALLPTGHPRDRIAGLDVTLIDNGMPVVILRAVDVGVTGIESPAELEANVALSARIEQLRLAAAPYMNLGDVTAKSVPKVCLVAPPQHGGTICTRTYIPRRVHDAIGVLGAVSVATACALPESIAAELVPRLTDGAHDLAIEHPTGALDVRIDLAGARVARVALLRTARPLMRGDAYIPEEVWQ